MISWIKYDYLTPIIEVFLVLLSDKIVSKSVILVVNLHNTKLHPFDDETADKELFVVYIIPEIGHSNIIDTSRQSRHFKSIPDNLSTHL